MVLGWQALEAQKADKPLEQGRALEQVAARMKRVMGLTKKLSRPPKAGRLERQVRIFEDWKRQFYEISPSHLPAQMLLL